MKSDARWLKTLVSRVLLNAVVGGFWFAFVGALCGAIAGGFYGALFYDFEGLGAFLCAEFGALFGIASGVIGGIIYAIAAAVAVPGELFLPYFSLKKRVALGQLAGTLITCSAFLIFWLAKAQTTVTSLSDIVATDRFFLISAPILMIFGAIAAALTKRDSPKAATLNTE